MQALYTTIQILIRDLKDAWQHIEKLEAEKQNLNNTIVQYQEAAANNPQTNELNLELDSLRGNQITVVEILAGEYPTYLENLKECWRNGRKIEAVKRMRAFTGAGLKESKLACDELWNRWSKDYYSEDNHFSEKTNKLEQSKF